MKILFTISQLGGGGAERVLSLLSSQLAQRGHQVSVVTWFDVPPVYPLHPSVKHIELHCPNNHTTGPWIQLARLRRVFKQEKPDIIFSFLVVVNMFSILAHVGLPGKLIVSERNDPNQNPRTSWARTLRNWLYRWADGFVFQTPDAKNYFAPSIQKRSTVIANPLSAQLPEPFTGERKKVFVTAVRLAPQKNLPMLVRAFARLHTSFPDYTLEIYGEGTERDTLQQLISTLQADNFIFLKGFAKDLYTRIAPAAAFVLPSNYEGLSNSMIEALALGVPIISTDHPIGGARMLIKHQENGLLVPVGDENALQTAMQYVIENPQKADSMAQKATQVRVQLSLGNITNLWEQYAKTFREARV